MRVSELVGETGLAHAGFAHHRHHLAAAGIGLGENPAQVLDLGVTADEARAAAQCSSPQARAGLPCPGELEDLDGIREAFDGNRTE